jgi:hypothetical protein
LATAAEGRSSSTPSKVARRGSVDVLVRAMAAVAYETTMRRWVRGGLLLRCCWLDRQGDASRFIGWVLLESHLRIGFSDTTHDRTPSFPRQRKRTRNYRFKQRVKDSRVLSHRKCWHGHWGTQG